MLTADESGYITRNSQEFHYCYSTPTPEQSGMMMQENYMRGRFPEMGTAVPLFLCPFSGNSPGKGGIHRDR